MQNLKNYKSERRDFIKKSVFGITGVILAPTILQSCVKGSDVNSRVLIGHIGVGSRGGYELKDYFLPLEGSHSVAICDVWRQRREQGAKFVNGFYNKENVKAPGCKAYLDFEELLQRDDIDAVNITTPDHWHVTAAIKAARAGKHIMLAKPLGLSYPNYKILEKELIKNNVRFHYGTQQRSMRHMQLGIEMIREGKIGEIERVDVWAPGKNPVISPECIETPVPDDFDYNKWTGPAPLKPYCPDRVTNNSSWFQYEYSIGFLGGWGAHPLDIMVWGIKNKVNCIYSCEGTGKFWSEGGIYNNIYSWNLNYKYQSGIELNFVSTDEAYKEMLNHRTFKEENGTTFYGTKGWISLSRSSAQSNISDLDNKLNNFPKNKDGWINSEENRIGQMFLDVINGKSDETCPLDEAIISDTISHMGDIAIRMNDKVSWDPEKGKIIDNIEANKLYVRKNREPFII